MKKSITTVYGTANESELAKLMVSDNPQQMDSFIAGTMEVEDRLMKSLSKIVSKNNAKQKFTKFTSKYL